MKQSIILNYKRLSLFVAFSFVTLLAFAQDTAVSSTTTTTTTTTEVPKDPAWYMQPWAWVVGGIVLLLIIIMAARGGSKNTDTDTVTVKRTTVVKDSNTEEYK